MQAIKNFSSEIKTEITCMKRWKLQFKKIVEVKSIKTKVWLTLYSPKNNNKFNHNTEYEHEMHSSDNLLIVWVFLIK